MVTVELMFEEDELVELLMNEFALRYSFDDTIVNLMEQYFTRIVNDGSCSLFYGPSTLEDYVVKTWDSMAVIDSRDPSYDEVARSWDAKGGYSLTDGEVVAKYNNTYLVVWY